VLDLEADRFMNLKYSVDDFKKEAGAVLGEYNKNASNPFLLIHEKLRDAAFTRHSYKHTTMGFLRDIEAMPDQYDYSRIFFDRYYRPENCILLVVGDVESKQLVALARKYFGGWKRGSYRIEVPPEPPQAGEKRVDLTWPNPTQPYLYIGYHTPAFSTTSKEMPAIDLVSQMLFSEAAPLYQKLVVEEQEVDLLSGGASDHRDPYLFEIVARVKRPDRVAYVESAITAALEDIKSKPVDAARLQRVQSHMKYSYAMGLSTAGSVASSLAHYLMLTGDPESVNQVYALYDQVTPEDLRAAAGKCFLPAGRTVVTLRFAGDTPKSPDGDAPPSADRPLPGRAGPAGTATGRGRR
jgi:zinc protease